MWVVEDAAEAYGATYRGRPVGGLGSIATWSFYGNKILTSGEGGALSVDDPELEARIRLFRGQGMDPERRYWFTEVGYNYRLTNVACAILCAQIERVEEMLSARRHIFDLYRQGLADTPGIGLQPIAEWATAAPWLFSMTVDEEEFGMSRDDLMGHLDADGIETRPLFIPIHTLPPYRNPSTGARLPHTDRLGSTGVSLPTSSAMTDADVDRVVTSIGRASSR